MQKVFTVEMMANKNCCRGEDDYSNAWYALDGDNGIIAIQYDGNNKSDNRYNYLVLSKMVRAETGSSAIFKFQKWQKKGLSEEFLLSEES